MRLSLLLAPLRLVAGMPASAQSDQTNPEGGFADLQAMVSQMRTSMYAQGELVPGWDRGGADPDSALRAAGADRHFFAVDGSGGRSVGIITARPLTAFAPAAWRVIDTYGASTTRLDNPSLLFQMLSRRYAVGIRANGRRVRDADCTDPIANATLYEIPGAAAEAGDEMIPVLFRVLILAGDGQVVCARSDGNRQNGWRARYFSEDGHRLPGLDEQQLITIVPAGPLERLVSFVPTTQS